MTDKIKQEKIEEYEQEIHEIKLFLFKYNFSKEVKKIYADEVKRYNGLIFKLKGF